MRSHRAGLNDDALETYVYFKCTWTDCVVVTSTDDKTFITFLFERKDLRYFTLLLIIFKNILTVAYSKMDSTA